MKSPNDIMPPKWLCSFFRWYCHPDYVEDLEGDIQERFERNFASLGKKKANWLFFRDVLSLFRPGIIRPFNINHPLIHFDMIRHHLILTFRSFKRYKSTFFINLIGLSAGLACALLIYLWVNDELQIDKFHEKDARLYQLLMNTPHKGEWSTTEQTPGPLSKALKAEFPEVEHATSVYQRQKDKGVLSIGEKHIKASDIYAGTDYFELFSYPLLEGAKSQVLKDKNALVISDELAIKVFGTTKNLIGKAIEWRKEVYGNDFNNTFLITGVFQKPPSQSSLQFDVIFNFELFQEREPGVTKWTNGGARTYITLKPGADINQFNQKIANFIKSKDGNSQWTLISRKYSDKYLYGKYENGQVAGGRIEYVRLFSLIALFILAIACINFMNLSTARASRRLKEVGVKKVIGASRKTLMGQYLGESMLMTILSLITALVLVSLILPYFNNITDKALRLDLNFNLVIGILTITLLTGFIAGSYPALYLSSFNPVAVLKGKINTSTGELWARKGLVIFQFTISIILIVSVLVVYKQIQFIQTKNLGFNKDNLIMFKREGNINSKLETFLSEVKKIPGIINVGNFRDNLTVNGTSTGGVTWEGRDPNDRFAFKYLSVNYDLLETLEVELKEGRFFSREYGSDTSKIIFNEAAIERMGLENPIGKVVTQWRRKKQIIGVVKNFHFESLYEEVKPCFIQLEDDGNNIVAKIKAGTEKETIAQLQAFYQEFNQDLPFEFKFMDANFQAHYTAENRVATLSSYFAGLAILISCLGLFGLATFTAQRRFKEIGIRKVLGASVFSIIRLLSSDFTKMVLVAILVALPISYLITKNWLDNFAFKIALEWWLFLGAGALSLLIAWLTVGAQIMKVANINPIQCLRDE